MRIADAALDALFAGLAIAARVRRAVPIGDRRRQRWPEAVRTSSLLSDVACNICGWNGRAFNGMAHCESAVCPSCGSIARDRFLHWCWHARTPYHASTRLLETSPRLGNGYRRRMGENVDYLASDYDEGAHLASVRVDLQAMDFADDAFDVVLTAHVLEHVPDTDAALAELRRVLRPGGHAFLQVPVPHGRTAASSEPEYHGDDTLVHWRFGWDLQDRLRNAGFRCQTLVTEELHDDVAVGFVDPYDRADFDAPDLMAHAVLDELTVVADRSVAARFGFVPAFQFVTFDASLDGPPLPAHARSSSRPTLRR